VTSVTLTRGRLYSPAFVSLCLAIFLGFSCFAIVSPVIPVVVLESGGDAFLVGVMVALYSVPSILLRPYMGRLVDEWSRWRVLLAGATGIGLSSLVYLFPGLAAMAVARVLNGSSFAAMNTGGTTSMATLAPADRRAEAASVYNLMPALAYMLAPAIGLLLLGALGSGVVFLLAGLLGVGAALVVGLGPLRRVPEKRSPPGDRSWRGLMDPSVMRPMTIELLWMTTNVLFFTFPPVWAAARDIPFEALAFYYPIMGIALVASRIVLGRRLDHFSRGGTILAGAAGGCAAILLAATAETVIVLTVAGAIYAASATAVSPPAAAMAMERADPERRGAAMATYSMGFPLGNGLGALLWGTLIGLLGFTGSWLVALLTMGGIMAIVWSARGALLTRRPPSARGGSGPGP
jgi:MFS family permease